MNINIFICLFLAVFAVSVVAEEDDGDILERLPRARPGGWKRKFCKYNNKKIKKNKIAESFPEHCAVLRCVVAKSKRKIMKLVLEADDSCECSFPTPAPPPGPGKRSINGRRRNNINNISQRPNVLLRAKARRCKYNKQKLAEGEVADDLADNCLQLVCCKVGKRKLKIKAETIADCHCGEDIEDHDECSTDTSHWTYEGHTGTSCWPSMFQFCGGSRQSPIHIMRDSSVHEDLGTFAFSNFDTTPTTLNLKNNGHSVQSVIDDGVTRTVFGGSLIGDYTFLQYHFHWGSNNSVGSEHVIDGMSFPMELHIVNWKTSYGDLHSAIEHSDGLAVLGFMFHIVASDNEVLTPLINALSAIKYPGNTTTVTPPMSLLDLMPSDLRILKPKPTMPPNDLTKFYRYLGSLTTPTCNEVVIWTVFDTKIPISSSQMAQFRELMDDAGHHLVDNFRPVQDLHGRDVILSGV